MVFDVHGGNVRIGFRYKNWGQTIATRVYLVHDFVVTGRPEEMDVQVTAMQDSLCVRAATQARSVAPTFHCFLVPTQAEASLRTSILA